MLFGSRIHAGNLQVVVSMLETSQGSLFTDPNKLLGRALTEPQTENSRAAKRAASPRIGGVSAQPCQRPSLASRHLNAGIHSS